MRRTQQLGQRRLRVVNPATRHLGRHVAEQFGQCHVGRRLARRDQLGRHVMARLERQAMVARQRVGQHGRVGVANVRVTVHVVDRGGDVERSTHADTAW